MDSKLKVLQLGSPSGLYGAEMWILSIIKYFDTNIVDSIVGSINDEQYSEIPLCSAAEKLGFKTLVIEAAGRSPLSAALKLRKTILENDIDIVHSHGYKSDLISLLATIGTPCKTISTPHGWTNKPDPKLFLYEIMDRMIFPLFSAVVPLSAAIYQPLKNIPILKSKLHLIINGVDIKEIEECSTSSLAPFNINSENDFVIGYIGRLTHGKGLDLMLRAIGDANKPHWKIILIGAGEQEEELREICKTKGVESNVQFLGFRQDRLELLKSFDLFILPSLSEGIPRCVMEAMSAEVPVIASNIPGCRNLIDGHSTGLLFDLNKPEQIPEKISKLESDKDYTENIKTNAKQFIKENFSAERMAKEYQELFIKLS